MLLSGAETGVTALPSSGCTIAELSKTLSKPCRISTSPWPPASTTPAFFKTGSCSGVFASASFAAIRAASAISIGSLTVFASSSAASAAIRITVSIVPSVGFITALYAASIPSENAFATAFPSPFSSPLKAFEKPLNIRDRITPLFPRAPLKRADAQRAEASLIVQSAADIMVRVILVPVSPSGTGNIFSASTAWRLFAILFDAEIIPSRNILPVIILRIISFSLLRLQKH